MTREQQAARRSGAPRPLLVVLLAALGVAALAGPGCTPDVPSNTPPAFVELQFDPSSTPPKSYEPTLLVTNAETGKLDFSAAGMEIPLDPAECQTQTALPLAACEFYWYLEQLDGFPTLTPGRTPVSAAIDLATVTVPDNLFIYEFLRGQAPVTAVDLAYDAEKGYLNFDPQTGWDVGGLYLVAVRGYETGIKDTAGNPGAASLIYVLLKQDSSLSCGATTAAEVQETCDFYQLFAGDARFASLPPEQMKATIAATLLQLEQLRQLYKGEVGLPFSVWDQVESLTTDLGNPMPPEQVAILWAFRTHTASVIELNPNKGMAPVVVSETEFRLKAKGPIAADTLEAFTTESLNGSVFVLNATAFLGGDLVNALPAFTPTFDDATNEIVITTTVPLMDASQYIVVVTNEVEGKPGAAIVPSPVTVLLRSRGSLVDDLANCATDPITATSTIASVAPAEACQLEEGRLQFQLLLDDATVKALTTTTERPSGLTREIVAYLYGFEYTAQ